MSKKKNNVISGEFVTKTDIGRIRVTNEDRAIALINASGDVLLCVCDGIGGQNRGDYAATLAINLLEDEFKLKNVFHTSFGVKRWLSKTLRKLNSQIFNEAYANRSFYKNMGTTIVLALLHKDDIYVVSVGDSRAYMVGFEKMKQITEDQTYSHYLYKTGKISREQLSTDQNRHVLTDALGIYPSLSFEIKVHANLGNSLFLCSDGVYNNLSEAEMHAILTTKERIEKKIDTIVNVANSNGGSDNMGIAYWEATKSG